MKYKVQLLLILLPFFSQAQKKTEAYEVKYNLYENEQKTVIQIGFIYNQGVAYLSKPNSPSQQFIDFNNKENSTNLQYEGKTYRKVTPFEMLPKATIDKKTKSLLGFTCHFATFSYFSNTIDVWYTEDAKAKGSPYSNYLPSENALVLELSVNGSLRMRASSIEKKPDFDASNRSTGDEILVNDAEFEELKINSRYKRFKVFSEEKINFDPSILPAQEKNLALDSVYHFSKGAVIMKKIKLPAEAKNSESVFVKLTCRSNGDAYDRTGSVFMVPAHDSSLVSVLTAYQFGLDKLPVFKDNQGNEYQGIVQEKNYAPPVEWMRFYTSFGVGNFNEKRKINHYDWAENAVYKQDISELVPINADEFWVGVFIGNYDKGGHIVSLELDFYPWFILPDSLATEKFISPLFSTVNTLEMSGQNYGSLFGNDTLNVNFTVPENTTDLKLLYTATGHGGWEGGDEFNPKMNRIFIDGKEIFSIVPWRTDCASYRLSNPASGNFENGLSSSDLSRSNWCPATLTPPYQIPLTNLQPGIHTLKVVIDQGEKEGNNSSHWNVTGVLTGKLSVLK